MNAIIEDRIAQELRRGARWVRSFNHVPQVLANMRQRGLVDYVAPQGGTGANMVRLTDAGRVHYFKGGFAATRQRKVAQTAKLVNRFADLLADGWSATAAARELGRTQQTGSSWLRQIRIGLGAQAEPDAIGPDLTTPEMVEFLAALRARREGAQP